MCALRVRRSVGLPTQTEVDMDSRLSQQLVTIRQTEALERAAAARIAREARRQERQPRRAARVRARLAPRLAR